MLVDGVRVVVNDGSAPNAATATVVVTEMGRGTKLSTERTVPFRVRWT